MERVLVTDYIGYEALTQSAMRGVVREALKCAVGANTTPGDHHFYVTFNTRAPGVEMADYLIEQFPQDMTIVIQHQFWDLEVHDTWFEIILKFAGVPQHLKIPFNAITRFVDPSVNFGLSFESDAAANSDRALIGPLADAGEPKSAPATSDGDTTVINLDSFRRK